MGGYIRLHGRAVTHTHCGHLAVKLLCTLYSTCTVQNLKEGGYRCCTHYLTRVEVWCVGVASSVRDYYQLGPVANLRARRWPLSESGTYFIENIVCFQKSEWHKATSLLCGIQQELTVHAKSMPQSIRRSLATNVCAR